MSDVTNQSRLSRLDLDWRFHLGDIDAPLPNTHVAAYMANKAGYARGAAKPNYDDSDWRMVELPHDWSVEGRFDPSNHMDAGFLPRGIGWYRRRVRLDVSDRGKYLAIRFDGVASHCIVYVNGHLLHRNFCGYTPFTIDISDIATFGDDLNVIALRVDATPMEGWWYEGAGIYRHTWLVKASKLHVACDWTMGPMWQPLTPRMLLGSSSSRGFRSVDQALKPDLVNLPADSAAIVVPSPEL